ncbi:hypothetical protein AGLY_013102 [Aphis glycines]|uniref:Uncharacterized protein n=1 Tax=Aphis glycines TaxID=307491 RepID=A0A6G0T7R8_APHGL|nr:hypothetical protein AGLY_013102 [Aphis glycines]
MDIVAMSIPNCVVHDLLSATTLISNLVYKIDRGKKKSILDDCSTDRYIVSFTQIEILLIHILFKFISYINIISFQLKCYMYAIVNLKYFHQCNIIQIKFPLRFSRRKYLLNNLYQDLSSIRVGGYISLVYCTCNFFEHTSLKFKHLSIVIMIYSCNFHPLTHSQLTNEKKMYLMYHNMFSINH